MTQELNMTLTQLIVKVVRAEFRCVSCQNLISSDQIRTYAETDPKVVGDKHIMVNDFKLPIWFAMKCKICEYQSALWKMLQDKQLQREVYV